MVRRLGVLLLFLASPLATAQEATTAGSDGSYVQFTSGRYVVGDVQLEPASGVPRYIKVDGERHALHQVRAYRLDGVEYAISYEDVARPILLVRNTPGRVQLYHEAGYPSGIDFIRLGDGPVDLATPANLKRAFRDHPAAMRHLRADRMYAVTGYAAILTGAVLVGAGTYFELTDSEAVPGMLVAASGVAVAVSVNALVPLLRQHHRRSAIRAFNQ